MVISKGVAELFAVLILVSASIFLGYIAKDVYERNLFLQPSQRSTDCNNLSLQETALCMREQIEPYYKYNLTSDFRTLSLDELKDRGGDCRDWSQHYVSITPDGFYSKKVRVEVSTSSAHAVTLLSNEEGYCVLDQMAFPYCTMLG